MATNSFQYTHSASISYSGYNLEHNFSELGELDIIPSQTPPRPSAYTGQTQWSADLVCDRMVQKFIDSPSLRNYGKGSAVIAELNKERKGNLCSSRSPAGNKGKQTPLRSAPEASGMQIWVRQSSPFFLPFLHILLLSFSTAPTSSHLDQH